MTLFDEHDTFMGLNEAQFDSRLDGMTTAQMEALYKYAKDTYYDGQPIMSDSQFDRLESVLSSRGSSVMEQVGGGQDGKLIHKHWSPMLSLKKVQVKDGEPFPMQDILQFLGGRFPLEGTPKYDGNGIELQYERGVLVKAITRGKNGRGADVTKAMRYIVPEQLPSDTTVEVRGEVVMPLDVFVQKYYKEGDGEDNKYANARNMIGGMLGRDEVQVEQVKDSVFVAYSLKMRSAANSLQHVANTMSELKILGFNKRHDPPRIKITDQQSLRAAYEWFKDYRKECPMQLDGIVLKMPEAVRGTVGENNHHPKWALSIKFPAMLAQTTIRSHVWTVGKTGHLSPVGILEPVELDGTMVTRTSLYNKSKIAEYRTFPGAVVTIRKAGDIIPQIVSVDRPAPDADRLIAEDAYYPKECPSCGSGLEIQKDHDTEHLVCTNHSACPAQVSRKLANGLQALGIKRIGESTCEDLAAAGVRSIFDFFDGQRMNEQSLVSSGRFVKGRQLEIVMAAAKSLKQVDLDRVVLALQLPGVGRTVSGEVAKQMSGQRYSFDGMDGEVVGQFRTNESPGFVMVRDFVERLRDSGVRVNLMEQKTGVPFEMTGSPKGAGFSTKEDFIQFMAGHGYMSAKLKDAKMLVTDSYSSSSGKMSQARSKGLEIVTYEDIVERLKKQKDGV